MLQEVHVLLVFPLVRYGVAELLVVHGCRARAGLLPVSPKAALSQLFVFENQHKIAQRKMNVVK